MANHCTGAIYIHCDKEMAEQFCMILEALECDDLAELTKYDADPDWLPHIFKGGEVTDEGVFEEGYISGDNFVEISYRTRSGDGIPFFQFMADNLNVVIEVSFIDDAEDKRHCKTLYPSGNSTGVQLWTEEDFEAYNESMNEKEDEAQPSACQSTFGELNYMNLAPKGQPLESPVSLVALGEATQTAVNFLGMMTLSLESAKRKAFEGDFLRGEMYQDMYQAGIKVCSWYKEKVMQKGWKTPEISEAYYNLVGAVERFSIAVWGMREMPKFVVLSKYRFPVVPDEIIENLLNSISGLIKFDDTDAFKGFENLSLKD